MIIDDDDRRQDQALRVLRGKKPRFPRHVRIDEAIAYRREQETLAAYAHARGLSFVGGDQITTTPEVLNELAADPRFVDLYLHVVGGMTYPEIAARFKYSSSQVAVRRVAAQRRLAREVFA